MVARAIAWAAAWALAGCDAAASSRPRPPPERLLAAPLSPGWSVEQRNGCWVWNPLPQFNETVTWSGTCPNGPATGQGVAVWRSPNLGEARDEGSFRNGRLEGEGVRITEDGTRLEGSFRGGFLNGRGRRTWPPGVIPNAPPMRYEGEFRDGRRHGQGAQRFGTGDSYEGGWQDDDTHGQGVFRFANGDRYEGQFERGFYAGNGAFTRADGSRYEGAWRRGRAHGQGVDVQGASGVRRSGEWRDGCFVPGGGPPATGSLVSAGCP